MTKKKTIENSPAEVPAEPAESEIKEAPAAEPNETIKSTGSAKPFPIVGVGASAGGLAAFEAFFSGMPADEEPGMAFVLVQHLAPDHKSLLTDLIRHYTHMQVFEVTDGMQVQINCAYIIPPNHDMALLNGTLQLIKPVAPRGQRLPIDFFFRSLAHDQHEKAICVILSGTGSDGTQGLRAIKGEGGMAMAQSLDFAEYDGMPASAIDTGLVDYILPPSEMPAQLIKYVSRAFLGHPKRHVSIPTPQTDSTLKKIFILLRAQTNHDFSLYKPSTITRRIERRMAVQLIETMEDYQRFLQETPQEVEALFRDLLIGVTSFFRDPETFKALEEQVIPNLFMGKSAGSLIRVWSVGCSTGEEPYSLAILLHERMEILKKNYKVQIFATDIDSQAIAAARSGLYPGNIAADISKERLARYFESESGGSFYRIHKTIRDMLIFSEQDVIKDPPFSKLDLIVCRNLLIYMSAELQRKIIPLFHYALNPGGVLFLGTSESVSEYTNLFTTLDRKSKIYKRQEDFHDAKRFISNRYILPPADIERTVAVAGKSSALPVALPLRELTEQALLQQVIPSAALVNEQGDILYIHGRTGRYLEPAPGETGTNNILKMAREGLRRDLTTLLHQTVVTKENVFLPGLRVRTNGDFATVNLSIHPLLKTVGMKLDTPLFLIILREPSAIELEQIQKTGILKGDSETDPDLRISALKQELRIKEDYLQSATEELETSNEELKSSNEEMQSVNEELQSTNEELETSKEELQSVNEELSTVNAELQTKLADLSLANNDMNNLLAGTGIGTIFVDHHLRILRFTPAVSAIINLIASDTGRPVNHIVSNLVGYDQLAQDIQAVLDTLLPRSTDVQAINGSWYRLRIQPYRTLENVIAGAVITFMDITEMKHMQEALEKSITACRLAVAVKDARDAVMVQDMQGAILAWNPMAERLYGWSEAEALQMNIKTLIPKQKLKEELEVVKKMGQATVVEPYHTQRMTKDGKAIQVSLIAVALVNENGEIYAFSTTERELTQPEEEQSSEIERPLL